MDKQKDPKKVKMGKKSKAAGSRFELKVREDLEKRGWIVDKWGNNVEFEIEAKDIALCPGKSKHTTVKMDGKEIDAHFEVGYIKHGKLIKAKSKFVFNPQLKRRIPMGMSSGFPDFIAIQSFKNQIEEVPEGQYKKGLIKYEKSLHLYGKDYGYEVIGVESKMDGKLDKEEKEKCVWYLANNIFSKILIASKGTKRGEIVYNEFK